MSKILGHSVHGQDGREAANALHVESERGVLYHRRRGKAERQARHVEGRVADEHGDEGELAVSLEGVRVHLCGSSI